jgi:hypothetical protein
MWLIFCCTNIRSDRIIGFWVAHFLGAFGKCLGAAMYENSSIAVRWKFAEGAQNGLNPDTMQHK